MEKIHEEERDMWKAEHERHNKKIAQAVWEAAQEQRKHNEVSIFYSSIDLLCLFYI